VVRGAHASRVPVQASRPNHPKPFPPRRRQQHAGRVRSRDHSV
jgi:hypothetical protein